MSPTGQTPPASPALTDADVRKVARLARLRIDDDQVPHYRARLSSILNYVEQLRSLDLTDVEPLSTPLEMTGRLDADKPGETIDNATLMRMAPDKLEPFIRVPKVLGDGGGA
jgi:aspartyl-tRNA(Asn)/glutamyl-tRNA(Gln) amidotransferase subunit C